jgi:hypothetical protein
MKRFAVAITIGARSDTIWSILTDAPGYPTGNSTIYRHRNAVQTKPSTSYFLIGQTA